MSTGTVTVDERTGVRVAKPMRVLSIDGGGIRGLISASILVEVEAMLRAERGRDARLADHFDLFAGTSTGGIIACLLLVPERASGDAPTARSPRPALTAQDVVDFYVEKAPVIFGRTRWQRIRRWGGLTDERYDDAGFERALAETLGPRRPLDRDVLLSDLVRPTVIPTYNATAGGPYFFKQHRTSGPDGQDFAVRDVARATAAAPTYFEPVEVASTRGPLGACVDGGLFANNPTMCAYAEAQEAFGHGAADMAVLSLGTGTSRTSYTHDDIKDWGVVSWIKPMLDMMLVGSDRTVDHHMGQVFATLGADAADAQYLRIQADLSEEPPERARMDDVTPENLARLVAIGQDVAEAHRPALERFLTDQVLGPSGATTVRP